MACRLSSQPELRAWNCSRSRPVSRPNRCAVAIDLNAVPPAGLAGIEVTDKAVDRNGVACYGAIGVGGTKMKIHKAAIGRLFASNDQILDAEQLYEIGQSLS